jgi:hypothetical protein
MAERIHIVVDRTEKEQFRGLAARDGKSLSEWLRDAAREKAAATEAEAVLGTVEDLRVFFAECDEREPGTEPDWEQHRSVIDRSVSRGAAES